MPRSDKPETVIAGAPDDVLNEAAVAELLGCNVRLVAPLFAEGKLTGKRHGNGGWRTTRRAVLAYIEDKEADGEH
jgi:hypothetical protein